MNEESRLPVLSSCSGNRKSKTCTERRRSIKNPKWVGLFALVVILTMCGVAAEAQQRAKIPKIGWFAGRSASAARSQLSDLQRELRALGYIEGMHFTSEYRYADNKLDRFPALADELVGLKVDVLIARSPRAALAAKNATRTIPIVFYDVADPVALGLIDSLARPGGNLTGLTIITEVLVG